MDQINAKQNQNISSALNSATFQDQNASTGDTSEISNQFYSVSVRRDDVGTVSPDKSRATCCCAHASCANDTTKLDETTVRVTNLSEETREQDLHDLFTPFGQVNRVLLAKDKTNNTSKGFAFVTFNDEKDAQKAIECVSGFGYDHMILKVEWAKEKKPQHQ